jgi:hypothetical protein
MNIQKNFIKIGAGGLIFTIVTIGPALGFLIFRPLSDIAQNIGGEGDPDDFLGWMGDPLMSLNERFTLVYGVYGVLFIISLIVLIVGIVRRKRLRRKELSAQK